MSMHTPKVRLAATRIVFDRGLQQLARSFPEQLFEKRPLFIFSSLTKRDHFTLWHLAHPFFLASSGEAAGFVFVTERMRLFSAPHPQLSVIPQETARGLQGDRSRKGGRRRRQEHFKLAVAEFQCSVDDKGLSPQQSRPSPWL